MDRKEILEHIRSHHFAALKYRREIKGINVRQREVLRAWQAQRLAKTYADLLEQPRYHAAAEFFLSDLYGTGDLTRRDEQLTRALPTMVKLAPPQALEPLALAIEVDALTEWLDYSIGKAMFDNDAGEAGDAITINRYGTAYRACDNRDERERQIDMIIRVGEKLDQMSRVPMLSTTVRMMRGVANSAGFGELQSFLERGLAAFHKMRGPNEFLDIVRARELRIMDQLFRGIARPFAIE